MNAKLPLVPDLRGTLDFTSERVAVRGAVQKVFQDLNDTAVLFSDETISEALVKSYLGNPDKGFEELNLPVAHHQPISAQGLLGSTQAEIPNHVHFVFIVQGSPLNAQLVSQHIHEIRRLHGRVRADRDCPTVHPSFWIAAYPSAGLAFQKVLNMAAVMASGDTKLRDLHVHYFPFDRDLLSMHRPSALKEQLVDSNPAILHEVAMALFQFARSHGLPRRIHALGHGAVLSAALLRGALMESAASGFPKFTAQKGMAKWVIFDRMADLVTPLMSQLTMEGRLDDLQNTSVRAGWLPGERGADTDPHVMSIKVLLNSSTAEWREWREKHVQELPSLQARASELESSRRGLGAAETWIRANHLRYLQRPLHYLGKDMLNALQPGGPVSDQHAAEIDHLEHRGRRGGGLWSGGGSAGSPADELVDLIAAGASFELCARRLCLSVMSHGALTEVQFGDCSALLLGAFGHQHIHTITNLQAAGLMVQKVPGAGEAESSLQAVRALLDRAEQNTRSGKEPPMLSALVSSPEEMPGGENAEHDEALSGPHVQPYGRYLPLSALLLKHAMRRYMPEWVKRHLRNCAVCQGRPAGANDTFASYAVLEQPSTRALVPERQDIETPMAQQTPQQDGSETTMDKVLIVMLGGASLAELTAIRAAAAGVNLQPVVLTTDISTGDRMIQSFMPDTTKLASADARATMAAL